MKRGTKTKMRANVTGAAAEEEIVSVILGRDTPQEAPSLELRRRIEPTGESVADFRGELDAATAEMAVSYVENIIDRHRGVIIADLSGLRFCDARGLSALVRMANYAEQAGRLFWLASPSPMLQRLIRITGLDDKLPVNRWRPGPMDG